MKLPDPIDVHVGKRLKLRRQLVGMSQGALAEGVALTFQQVQKYEKGTNRIGSSRLQQFATILQVSPAYFFEDAPAIETVDQQKSPSQVFDQAAAEINMLKTADGRALLRAFTSISNDKLRKRIVSLVEALAEESASLSAAG